MTDLSSNIGWCIILSQQIEAHLGTLLVLERRERFKTDECFISASAQVRTQPLEVLKKELADLNVQYLKMPELEAIIDRRNWIAHRLTFDSRFIAAMKPGSDDVFLDVLLQFYQCYEDVRAAYRKRYLEIAGPEAQERHSDDVLKYFGTAITERALDVIKNKKKRA